MHTVEINLNGKRALVTGGNTGIGAAIVTRLAAAGAKVVVNYIVHPELASALASYITGTTIYIDGAYSSNLVRYDPRKWEMFSQEKK